MQKVIVDDKPHLCLFALTEIYDGTELRYNYGTDGLWWRKNKASKKTYNLYHLNEMNCHECPENLINDQESIDLCAIDGLNQVEQVSLEKLQPLLDETTKLKENIEKDEILMKNYGDFICQIKEDMEVIDNNDSEHSQDASDDCREKYRLSRKNGSIDFSNILSFAKDLHISGILDKYLMNCQSDAEKEKYCNLTWNIVEDVEWNMCEKLSEDLTIWVNQTFSKQYISDKTGGPKLMALRKFILRQYRLRFRHQVDFQCNETSTVTSTGALYINLDPDVNDAKFTQEIKSAMEMGDLSQAKNIFKEWVGTKKAKTTTKIPAKTRTKCPVCNELRVDLKLHLICKHGFDEVSALGLKSQMNLYKKRKWLPDDQRKTKRRLYPRRNCSFPGCSKVISRLDNHLRQTHKVKDDVVFQNLLRSAPYELPEPIADDRFSDPSDDEELEKREFKNVLRQYGHKELRLLEIRGSEESDNDDPDWIVEKIHHEIGEKEKRKKAALKILGAASQDTGSDSKEEEDMQENGALSIKENENFSEYLQENGALMVKESDNSSECEEESGYESEGSEDDEDDVINIVMTPRWSDDILLKFKDWLKSPDGKLKSERSAKQRSRQVLVILKTVSPEEYRTKDLFDRVVVRTKWLNEFDKSRRPGTVKSYLGSLKLFYEYVICDEPSDIDISSTECHKMITVVRNWSSSYKNKVNFRKWEKQLEDLNKMITAEELLAFDNSDLVEECRLAIDRSKHSNKAMAPQVFTSCRDYIITSLILGNASRPGALRNMTLKEFLHAKMDNNVYLVSVLKHKTTSTSGPAILAFCVELYDHCNIFLQKIRNQLPGITTNSESPLFVSWSGRKMSTSLIGDQFNSFFKRALNLDLMKREGRRLTTTLVRKSFVSKGHTAHPDLKKDLSNMMCHSQGTAEQAYFLEDKAKNVAKTFTTMQRTMRQKTKEEDVDAKVLSMFSKELESGEKISLNMVRYHADELANISLSEKQVRDKLRYFQLQRKCAPVDDTQFPTTDSSKKINVSVEDEYVMPPTDELLSSSDESPEGRSRSTYLPKEEDFLKNQFADMITGKGVLIRRKDVEKIVKKNKELQLLVDKYGMRRILVKIRTEKRKIMDK